MKLTGKIEGQPVTFTLISEEGRTSVFEAEVPATLDGEYVVELTAVDDAGNITFVCRYLVTIDMANMCVHLVPLPEYYLVGIPCDYEMTEVSQGFALIAVCRGYNIKSVGQDYWLEPIYPDCRLNLGGRI